MPNLPIGQGTPVDLYLHLRSLTKASQVGKASPSESSSIIRHSVQESSMPLVTE